MASMNIACIQLQSTQADMHTDLVNQEDCIFKGLTRIENQISECIKELEKKSDSKMLL